MPDEPGNLGFQIGTGEPLPKRGLARGLGPAQMLLHLGDLFRLLSEDVFLLRRWEEQRRRRDVGRVVVSAPLIDAVEECPQGVIVLLQEGVVLVVMTAT